MAPVSVGDDEKVLEVDVGDKGHQSINGGKAGQSAADSDDLQRPITGSGSE